MSIIKIPDIGDFDEIEVIEILVNVGDSISENQDLITLESDKATMAIPSNSAGVVEQLNLSVGDKVAQGTVILTLATVATDKIATTESESEPTKSQAVMDNYTNSQTNNHTEVLILGSGPGGYTAAFRAADLGKKVTLIERHTKIGGVCLNVGCIPSKALLHTAQIINEAREISEFGVEFAAPKIDVFKIKNHKDEIINKLTGGLKTLAKQRKVEIIHGEASFASANSMLVKTKDSNQQISFDNCIIAVGSRVTKIPFFPNDDARMMDSTDALDLDEIPDNMLVIGGGIIGLEMATVYHALGTDITVVELQDSLIPDADKDIIKPLYQKLKTQYKIYLNTKVTNIETEAAGLKVSFEGELVTTNKAPATEVYDKILVAVGRTPNGKLINAAAAGVIVNDYGFIEVNSKMQTNIPHIFAIGDIVGQPMLAHKATHEAKVAAEVIAGLKSEFTPLTIPSVAYTDPEVAWMGLSESEAKSQNIDFVKGAFPWAASGRSLSIGRDEGLTKVLFEKTTGKIIGAGIVGTNAGELIAEAVLALEMGADAEDIGLTIHPHPTLSETLGFAAEMAGGNIIDLIPPKKTLYSKAIANK